MSGTKRTCGGYRGRGEEEEGKKKKTLQEEDCGRMELNGEFVAAQRTSLDTRHLTAGGPRTRLLGRLQSPSRRLGGGGRKRWWWPHYQPSWTSPLTPCGSYTRSGQLQHAASYIYRKKKGGGGEKRTTTCFSSLLPQHDTDSAVPSRPEQPLDMEFYIITVLSY